MERHNNILIGYCNSWECGCRINICADRWVKKDITILLKDLPRPGKMGAIHKITHFVELVEHRTKVNVGSDENMLNVLFQNIYFSPILLPCHSYVKVDLIRTGKLHLPSRTGVYMFVTGILLFLYLFAFVVCQR